MFNDCVICYLIEYNEMYRVSSRSSVCSIINFNVSHKSKVTLVNSPGSFRVGQVVVGCYWNLSLLKYSLTVYPQTLTNGCY